MKDKGKGERIGLRRIKKEEVVGREKRGKRRKTMKLKRMK